MLAESGTLLPGDSELLWSLAEAAHDWNYLLDPEGRFIFVSSACERVTGYRPEEFQADSGLLLRLIHPDDRVRFEQHLGRIHEAAVRLETTCMELRIVARDGSERWIDHRCKALYGVDGRYLGRMASNQDIGRRKLVEKSLLRQNRMLRALADCERAALRATNEQKLSNDVCRILCDIAGYRMAWIGVAEQDETRAVRPIAWSGVEDGYLGTAEISWADGERGRGPTGMAIRSGRTSVLDDFAADAASPWRERAFQRGYRSSIALPLAVGEAPAFGALSIYSGAPSAFSSSQVFLLEQLAADLALRIDALRRRGPDA